MGLQPLHVAIQFKYIERQWTQLLSDLHEKTILVIGGRAIAHIYLASNHSSLRLDILPDPSGELIWRPTSQERQRI
jgi:hypothetical protein